MRRHAFQPLQPADLGLAILRHHPSESRRGLNPIDVGTLERARELEALGFLGITLQSQLNTGFGTAWKLVLPTAA